MKDFSKYNTKLPYPKKSEYTKVFIYKQGNILFAGTIPEWNALDKQPIGTRENAVDDEAFALARAAYRADIDRLTEEFKYDMFDEFEVADNKRAGSAFTMAWERGHSNGLAAVFDEFMDLAELIR